MTEECPPRRLVGKQPFSLGPPKPPAIVTFPHGMYDSATDDPEYEPSLLEDDDPRALVPSVADGGEPLGLFEESGISPESSVPLDVGVAGASGTGETVADAPWMDSSDGSAVPGEVVVRRLECRLVERVWSEVRDRNQQEIMDKLHTVPMDESCVW